MLPPALYNLMYTQCKQLELDTLKKWLEANDKLKPGMFEDAGFNYNSTIFNNEEGQHDIYGIGWIDFNDGYARNAQNLSWLPQFKILLFNTLDKKNYDALRTSVKRIAMLESVNYEKTEAWSNKRFLFNFQIVDFNEPLQKVHPSYVCSISFNKRKTY